MQASTRTQSRHVLGYNSSVLQKKRREQQNRINGKRMCFCYEGAGANLNEVAK